MHFLPDNSSFQTIQCEGNKNKFQLQTHFKNGLSCKSHSSNILIKNHKITVEKRIKTCYNYNIIAECEDVSMNTNTYYINLIITRLIKNIN